MTNFAQAPRKVSIWQNSGWLLTIALTLVAIAIFVSVYTYLVEDFGRITDFSLLGLNSDTAIMGTDYHLTVARSQTYGYIIYLETDLTNKVIFHATSLAEYTTFMRSGERYLVLRDVVGSNGVLDYVVVDISESIPRLIGNGQACSNPRLNGNSLEFYSAQQDCYLFPWASKNYSWQVKLD